MKWFGLEIQPRVLAPPLNFLPKIFVLENHEFSTMKGARAFGVGTPLHSKLNNKFVASFVRMKNGRRVSLHIDWKCALALWPSGGQLGILNEKTYTACFYNQPLICMQWRACKKRLGQNLFHLHQSIGWRCGQLIKFDHVPSKLTSHKSTARAAFIIFGPSHHFMVMDLPENFHWLVDHHGNCE